MAKVTYTCGNPPRRGYSYLDFVQYLARRLPVEDHVFRYKNSTQWRNNRKAIPLGLFKNVCHWKSPRRFNLVQNNHHMSVNEQWRTALNVLGTPPFNALEITNALKSLITLQGVAVPTASALLTAWNPNEFGIMDFKTLTILGMPRRDSAAAYVAFRNQLLHLKDKYPALRRCALRQIELALWHYYPINFSGPKQRPR